MKLLSVKSRLWASLFLLCLSLFNTLAVILPYSRLKIDFAEDIRLYMPLLVSVCLLVFAIFLQRYPSPRETLKELRLTLEKQGKLVKAWDDVNIAVEPFAKMSRGKKIAQLMFLFFGLAFFGLALADLLAWMEPLSMVASDGRLIVIPGWVTASLGLCVAFLCLVAAHLQKFRLTDGWQDELRRIAKDAGIKY